MLKSAGKGCATKYTVTECEVDPSVPVTVIVKLPETLEEANSGVEADPPDVRSKITLVLETTLVNDMLGPGGYTVAETFTLPENPPRLVRVMVELSPGPVAEEGLAEMLKSGLALAGWT